MKLLHLFRKSLPLQLGITLVVAFVFGSLIPELGKSFFYSLSLQLQEILVFFLPFIVFSYLFACLLSFENNVLLFLGCLLVFVVLSTFLSLYYAYGVGSGCFYLLPTNGSISHDTVLSSLGHFKLQKIPNNYALITGLVLGLFFFYFRQPKVTAFSQRLREAATFFLKKLFIPILPLFIFGFALKMEHEGMLPQIVQTYLPIFVALIVSQAIYVLLMFGIAAKFNVKSWKTYLKNTIAPAVTGFSTMSSAATMPSLLQSAEINTKNPIIVQTYIPASINIHHVGDAIVLPILMMATLISFGHPIPDLGVYSMFCVYYMLYKFGAAAVPGGGVVIMLPVLQNLMGFDQTMQGFVTTLYILMDPFITVANVAGNGASAIMFSKVFSKRSKD